jgi:hypothetical protein
VTATLKLPAPAGPLDVLEVARRYPALRQSLLSSADDCMLSAYFNLAHGQLWSTHPQARGTIMHRTIAECLRTMVKQQEDTIPVSEALEILAETLWQRDVPDDELVRVPVKQIGELRRFVAKFARDNSFDIRQVVAIEKRLAATVSYPHPVTGEVVQRTLTGQLDCLMYQPPRRPGEEPGALVIDWKDTWGLPPDHSEGEAKGEEDDGSGLSWHGYFQQRFYAWLVMRNYPKVNKVTLREFYIRQTQPRPATVERKRLHLIEQELGLLAAAFDAAVAQGKPAWPYRLEDSLRADAPAELREQVEAGGLELVDVPQWVHPSVGRWRPSPGKHCGYCLKPGACPIEREARGEGAIADGAQAERYVAEALVAKRVYDHRMKAVKAWAETRGPVFVKWAKGRMEARWQDNATGNGRRFGIFPAKVSDRSSKQERAMDARLIEAAKDSAERARAARRRRPARDGGRS